MNLDSPTAMTLWGLLLSVAAVGCGKTAPSERHVTVELASRTTFEQTIAKHKGKVVLVDCWATWCPPCVEQFPHTVQLSKKYDSNNFAVVSVSMDEPDDQERVLQFLRIKEATFDNLLSEYGVGIEGFEAFEITDGAIPHYKVYDRLGKLRHIANSNEHIEHVIEQLLNEE